MHTLHITIDGHTFTVVGEMPRTSAEELTLLIDDAPCRVRLPDTDSEELLTWLIVDDTAHEVVIDPDLRRIRSRTGLHTLAIQNAETIGGRPAGGDGRVKAPIPGMVTRVLVAQGDVVAAGQPLLLLEAMKMENEIRAARAGAIEALHVAAGQGVRLGDVLVEIG
jgi:biotin carboxyl carrier protein